jgi:TRAP-type C4-dicarboxylate transport system permease small subunit
VTGEILLRLEQAMAWICRAIEWLIAVGLAIMVAMVFGNVVLRYGFNSGITVSEEVSRWIFIWCTFLGAIVAMREHGHLGVDMVVGALPAWGQKICMVVGHLLMLGVVVLLYQGSAQQVRINWSVTAPTTGASMAMIYLPGMVFSVLAGVLLLTDLGKALTGRLRDDQWVMVQESEEANQLRDVLDTAEARGKEQQP